MNKQISLRPGDNRISLRAMPDNSIDSVVCDPPYGLVSIQKRFGKEGAATARKEKNDGSFARLSGGFMGKAWDSTGIENDPEFWAEVLRVLKPGGYLVAFSSSRTFHRMTVAIEDAGFIIHPMIGWLNGQGFPKAHNAARAIEATMLTGGAAPKNMRQLDMGENYRPHELAGTPDYGKGRMSRGADTDRDYKNKPDLTTAEAKEWQGWAYGGQVRKPALEPICVAQKPFSEKSGAANILKWGVGAVNVDGCRTEAGRHPANIIHDGSPEVVALFPDSKGQQGDVRGTEPSRTGDENANCYGKFKARPPTPARGDTGSAARFFECYPFEDDPVFYCAKAGKEDRAGSKHPTVKPIALMQALIRHITPPGGVVLDPFAGSGTTGVAAQREGFDCILMEAEPEYIDFLNARFGLQDWIFG